MAAVRRANNRFSTLRSRIMRRSASGSQAGGDDLLRASRELSTLSVCACLLPSTAARAHRRCSILVFTKGESWAELAKATKQLYK